MDKPAEAPDVDYSTLTPKQFFLSVMRGEEQLDYDPELQMRIVRPPTFKERFAAASSVINYEHQRLMSSQIEQTTKLENVDKGELMTRLAQLTEKLNKPVEPLPTAEEAPPVEEESKDE